MPTPLTRPDFSEGSFTAVAKYLKRHWPDGEINLARARELLANCLGYPSTHEAEQSACETAAREDVVAARARAEACLQLHGGLTADQAQALATRLPLTDLACFQGTLSGPGRPAADEAIIVIEVHSWDYGKAWIAKNPADFCDQVGQRYAAKYPGEAVIERITLRELALLSGTNIEAPDDSDYTRHLVSLAAQHGWDTPLQRSKFLDDHPVIGPEPRPTIDVLKAHKTALHRIVKDIGAALSTPKDEPKCLFFHGFDEALRALGSVELDQSYWVEANTALEDVLDKAGKLPKRIGAAEIGDLDLAIEGPCPRDEESWRQITLRVTLRGAPIPHFEKTVADVLDGNRWWWPSRMWWRLEAYETGTLAARRLDELLDRFMRANLVPRGVVWPRPRKPAFWDER